MDYRVTLDPQFGISAFDFIVTWNATPECRAVAMARTSPATPVRFDVNVIAGSNVVLTGAGNETAAEVVCGLVRQTLEKRGIRQALEMVQADLPDRGREILVKA